MQAQYKETSAPVVLSAAIEAAINERLKGTYTGGFIDVSCYADGIFLCVPLEADVRGEMACLTFSVRHFDLGVPFLQDLKAIWEAGPRSVGGRRAEETRVHTEILAQRAAFQAGP